MNAAHAAQRLHLECGKGAREPGVASAQTAVHVARRQPQLARDRRPIARRIAQLVRRDADMIRLLGERQAQTVAVEQRAAPRLEHDPFGALGLRGGGVPGTFHELHLRRSQHQRNQRDSETDLHHAEPHERLGH